MSTKSIVLLTGFSPFGEHKINASWESIKYVPKKDLEKKYNIEIITHEIPVVYKEVDQLIPLFWEKYEEPKLVIHVGVSAKAKQLTLEMLANYNGYIRKDNDGDSPSNGISTFFNGKNKTITCGLDAAKLSEDYNNMNNVISSCVSSDAGRFLCEYIYYASLSMDSSKTLFIHVPDLDKPYSAIEIASGLTAIIELCLKKSLSLK